VKKALKYFLRTVKWIFIVLSVYLASLFFRQERLPVALFDWWIKKRVPENIVVSCESMTFGFIHGLNLRGIKVYDTDRQDKLTPIAAADCVSINFFKSLVRIDRAKYPRLPDSYYAPGNKSVDRGEGGLKFDFPELPRFRLVLADPDILSIRPESVECDVDFTKRALQVTRFHLIWPGGGEKMTVDGECRVDLDEARLKANVKGLATQALMRPFIDTLDVPVALEYMDAFTGIAKPVDCGGVFDVNLRNNDFSMMLDLHPEMGSYNSVPMKSADGKLHLFVYTRDDRLNYNVKVGPVASVNLAGKHLDGEVEIKGVGDLFTVDANAVSELPLQDFIRIIGFTDVDVGSRTGTVTGNVHLELYEPDVSDMSRLNGHGHVEIKGGHLSQLMLFTGITEHLAEYVPGVSTFVNQSSCTADFTISNGVFRSDNITVGGSVFKLDMKGSYDINSDKLDFTGSVGVVDEGNLLKKILLRPMSWTVSNLLFTFRLKGSYKEPEWEYISVFDKVVEAVK
jgi:hypothetical protein